MTTREQYIHRVGRTARAGRQGNAMLLISPFEQFILSQLKDLPVQNISQNAIITGARPSPALKKALDSVQNNATLRQAAEQAYQAFLGYYNSNLRLLRWSKADLVMVANEYSGILGLHDIPILKKVNYWILHTNTQMTFCR